ncbi:unnamed protein product [Mytilus coruscus]|uniref:Uncharacterized protein n=1 Tax=Mytilus coruscus TaxID=42192 RepID=A0A6J8D4C5_MYTCO|nr:unnamed protein product [Mytilus coruscus]
MIRRYVKKWLHLPSCTTDHLFYTSTAMGGLGLPRLSKSAPCSRINTKRAVLNSKDENITSFVKTTGIEDEIRDTADKLNIRIPSNPKQPATWRKNEEKEWAAQPAAGKGRKHFEHKCSNSWLQAGSKYLREGDIISALQVRADTYPTRVALARADGREDITCRRCKTAPETGGHISGHCPAMKGYRINRHNGIVETLCDRLKSKGWLVSKEPQMRDAEGKLWIPDIIAVKDGKAVLIDPTVVYESNGDALSRANQAKVRKYLHLVPVIKEQFGVTEVTVRGLAVGARGGWCKGNAKTMEIVGLNDKGLHSFICRFALRGTLNLLRIFTDGRGPGARTATAPMGL